MLKFKCTICNEEFNTRTADIHAQSHGFINGTDYFWKVVYKYEGEAVCKYCGKPLIFERYNRPQQYCGRQCWIKSDQLIENSSKNLKNLWKSTDLANKMKEASSRNITKYNNLNKESHANLLRIGSRDPEFMYKKLASRIDVSKPCILYLVSDSIEKLKVGISFNFSNRYKNLPKEIIRKVEFKNSYNCIKAECDIHNYFEDIALKDDSGKITEWYYIKDQEKLLNYFDKKVSELNI